MIKRSKLNNIILQKPIFCRICFAVTLYWRKVFETVFFYCSLFLLIYLLVYQFIYAYFVSIEFHGLAIDETFQLFNPLRRMGEGQTSAGFSVFSWIRYCLSALPTLYLAW